LGKICNNCMSDNEKQEIINGYNITAK
jgi:hypothetical protein